MRVTSVYSCPGWSFHTHIHVYVPGLFTLDPPADTTVSWPPLKGPGMSPSGMQDGFVSGDESFAFLEGLNAHPKSVWAKYGF